MLGTETAEAVREMPKREDRQECLGVQVADEEGQKQQQAGPESVEEEGRQGERQQEQQEQEQQEQEQEEQDAFRVDHKEQQQQQQGWEQQQQAANDAERTHLSDLEHLSVIGEFCCSCRATALEEGEGGGEIAELVLT